MSCSWKSCKNPKFNLDEDDTVEVKTIWPKRKVDAAHFMVKWAVNGEASFHEKCWEQAVSSRKIRGSSKTGSLKMSTQEKTLVKEAEKTAEYRHCHNKVCQEAKKVSDILKSANHCVAFTGAGISTSAGIGDYRGKSGKWTEMDQNKIDVEQLFCDKTDQPPTKKQKMEEEDEEETEDGVPYETLRPTYTHEALHKLMEDGYLKYIISQNGDGLHGLSGIPSDKLSELHGNVFLETCEKCGKEYYRSYYVMDDTGSLYYEELEDYGKTDIKKPKYVKKCDLCGLSHRTGRKCEVKKCSGYLKDSIINFRDLLDEEILLNAEEHSEKCDLMLCLGSTLTVTPACNLIEMIKKPQRYVICNRQETDKDDACYKKDKHGNVLGSRIFGDCDAFFRELMKNMYDEEDLKKWENERPERMKKYDTQRTT